VVEIFRHKWLDGRTSPQARMERGSVDKSTQKRDEILRGNP